MWFYSTKGHFIPRNCDFIPRKVILFQKMWFNFKNGILFLERSFYSTKCDFISKNVILFHKRSFYIVWTSCLVADFSIWSRDVCLKGQTNTFLVLWLTTFLVFFRLNVILTSILTKSWATPKWHASGKVRLDTLEYFCGEQKYVRVKLN